MTAPRAVTPTEHTNMQKPRQAAQFYALIDNPPAVFQARVNQDFGGNYDQVIQIAYDGVTYGAYTNIKADMTLLIGSASGLADRGVARIRKTPTSSTLYIGETSEIEIHDNDYLTVLATFEPWAKHLYISNTGIVYMDRDIVYSDQHASPDPAPVLGPDAITWLTGTYADVVFDASRSWVISGATVTFTWSAPGAIAMSGTYTATPTIRYNAVGRYLVYCDVTAGGKTFTGVRTVHVLGGAYQPTTQFTLGDISCDVETGGCSFPMTIHGDASAIRDRTKVIIFSKDYINLSRLEQGPDTGRENLWVAGWIVGESIRTGRKKSVSFEVQGEQYFLGQEGSFPVGYEDTRFANNGGGAPNSWTEFQDMTVRKVLWGLVHWRSTLTRMTDVILPDNTDKAAQIPAPYGSVWEQIRTIAESTILALTCFDRMGRLFVEIDQQMRPVADRTSIPVVMELQDDDLGEAPEFQRATYTQVGRLDISGVYYNNGKGTALGAIAPGNVQSRFGDPEIIENLILHNQQQTIDLAALIYGWRNNPYREINLDIMQINRFIDICPAQYCQLTISTTDNTRGVALTSIKVIPRRLMYRFNPKTGGLFVSGTFEAESFPGHAVKMDFPGSDGGPTIDDGGGDDDPPPPPPPPGEEGSEADVVVSTASDVRTTGTFDGISPAWASKVTGITGTVISFSKESDDVAYALTETQAFKTENLGDSVPTWSGVYDVAVDWDTANGATPQLMYVVARGSVYILCFSPSGSSAVTYLLRSLNSGDTWSAFMVGTITDAYDDFVMDSVPLSATFEDDGPDAYYRYGTIVRKDNDDDEGFNPWAVGVHSPTPWTSRNLSTVLANTGTGFPDISTFIHASGPGTINQETGEIDQVEFRVNGDSGFGSTRGNFVRAFIENQFSDPPGVNDGGHAIWMYRDAARVNVGIKFTSQINNDVRPRTAQGYVYVVWRKPTLNIPYAMDVGRHDHGVVYIGLKDKIVVTRDGGFSFEDYITEHGANDVYCPAWDNPDDRNLLYWSTDGHLYWASGIVDSLANKGSALLNETAAQKVPQRIAADPDSGWPVFALAYMTNAFSLYLLEPGSGGGIVVSQNLLVSGISGARSLRCYKNAGGRRILYLDATSIQCSDDDGDTFTNKIGDWTGYAGPVTIDAMDV